MIESSAHGDEYDGVIFSQLVCTLDLYYPLHNFITVVSSIHVVFSNLF